MAFFTIGFIAVLLGGLIALVVSVILIMNYIQKNNPDFFARLTVSDADQTKEEEHNR